MLESSDRVLYGYRITSGAMEGEEVWPLDLDRDADWLPFHENPHIPQIRISGEDSARSIREALDAAGVQGVPLRRDIHIVWGEVKAYEI